MSSELVYLLYCYPYITIPLVSFLVILTVCRIYMRCTIKYCKSKASMSGKVVIITGGSEGIGYEAAKELAKRDAKVIIASRNEDKGRKAQDNIITETGNKNVVFKRLDLSSLKSVRSFADHITSTESALHVLINNAGIFTPDDRYTEDNLIELMQVNHFGPFLLTLLLLPLLKKSKPSRIINVSSLAHILGKIDLDTLNEKKSGDRFVAYGTTKLCNVIFTVELARRLAGSGVVANALHPGNILTNIGADGDAISKVKFWITCLFFSRTANEGAQTIVHLAAAEECEGVSGEYFVDCAVAYKSSKSKDRHLCKRLWKVSEDFVNYKSDVCFNE